MPATHRGDGPVDQGKETEVPARWTGLGRPPPWLTDVLPALALAVIVSMASLTSLEEETRSTVPAAYALGGSLGAVTLFRRRWPVAVLVLSAVIASAYHAANFPAIGQGWPLSVALYTCASVGRLWPGILVGAGSAAIGGVARLLLEPEPVLPVLTSGSQEIAAMGLVLALGDAVRSRRGWTAEIHDRLQRLERDRDEETKRRVVDERLRIARELHDITAHTLAMAGVQLNVAADTLADSPDEARSALRTAQQANREAGAELKAAVRVLRQEHDDALPRSPTPGLDGVDRLLDGAREAGLRVEYGESGETRSLPAPVGLTVYRVIQESITNVLRHAHAATVRVQIGYGPDGISVRIVDDGNGPPPDPGPGDLGHGLIGMRERTLGLGGEFAAGPAPDGGFAVSAWIPIEATR